MNGIFGADYNYNSPTQGIDIFDSNSATTGIAAPIEITPAQQRVEGSANEGIGSFYVQKPEPKSRLSEVLEERRERRAEAIAPTEAIIAEIQGLMKQGNYQEAYRKYEELPILDQMAVAVSPVGGDLLAAYEVPEFSSRGMKNIQEGDYLGAAGNYTLAGLAGLSLIPGLGVVGDIAKSGAKGLGKRAAKESAQNAISKEGADGMLKIDKIKSDPTVSPPPASRIDDAEDIMKTQNQGYTYKGVSINQRQPIEVLRLGDGTFQQLGGKSSLAVLSRNNVDEVPVRIFGSKNEYEIYENARKAEKNILRKQNTDALMPKINSPTNELALEKFGTALNNSVKKTFNGWQGDLRTLPPEYINTIGKEQFSYLTDMRFFTRNDVHNLQQRAIRLNGQFQQEIDDIAKSMKLKTYANPDGSPGVIDSVTGHIEGQVKLQPRMISKSIDKYGGDATQITDAIRTRIIVDNPAQEKELIKRISAKYPALDSGRVLKPEGYLDRKLNIRFEGANGEPIIAEIGILTKPMWEASKQAHPIYKSFRAKFPQGMPEDPIELINMNRELRLEGERLLKQMEQIFGNAKPKINPGFYNIKTYALGGQVTTGDSGKSGRLSPMTPNVFSKSDFDNLMPSTKKSAICEGVASLQFPSSGGIKYPRSPSPTGTNTAGPDSHLKYNVSNFSITSSLQPFANNNNPKTIDIFEE